MIQNKHNPGLSRGLALAACLIALITALPGCASSKKMAAEKDSISTAGLTTEQSILVGVLGDVLEHHTDWTTAEISGKLKADGLPLSPSVKIYMKRDSDVLISIRAPFVGEVGRVDLTQDSLFAVNKLKKVYCLESAQNLMSIYPSFCSDLQSLLLGRVVVPGMGELSIDNITAVDVAVAEDMRKVSPKFEGIGSWISMDYMVDQEGRLSEILITGAEDNELAVADYDWGKNGAYDLTVTTSKKGMPFVVEFNLDSPKWNAERPADFKLGGGYRRVDIAQFLKSF